MNRPSIGIITNSCPPYRLHVHRRIVHELPEIRLYSLFTHERSDSAWAFRTTDEIGSVVFGRGESAVATPPLREWRKGGRIIDWIRQTGLHGVVVSGYNDLGRLRVINWCHRHGVPCVFHGDSNIRDDVIRGWRAVVKRHLLDWVIHHVDAILVCGTRGRDYYLKYGARPENIFYYPYEPDYELIRSVSPESLNATVSRFGLDATRRRITYSGRLVPVKRVDLLIDAFARIEAQRPEWDLTIVGDGPLRASLEARVPEQLRPRVSWTGFLDDQPAVSAIYRLSDVLVLPSDHEPWAVVINEAVSAGLAVVASEIVGAAAELVRDGVNGWIFQPGNLDHLTKCLLDTTDPGRIDEMKRMSAPMLEQWQQRGDPIRGLRQALTHVGVLGQ